MPNRLPIPDELQHLIEKREAKDRRGEQRRESAAAATTTAGSIDVPPETASVPATDTASLDATSRRKTTDRRSAGRRTTDG